MFDPKPLLIVFALGLFLREWRLVKASAVLFLDWAILTGVYQLTGDAYSSITMGAVDVVAAEIILAGMTTRWETALIITYAIEIVCHLSYLVGSHGEWSKYTYWWALNDIAWVQAGLCIAWSGSSGRRKLRHWLDRWMRAVRIRRPLAHLRGNASYREADAGEEG